MIMYEEQVYRGRRDPEHPNGLLVIVEHGDGTRHPLAHRPKHSPSGFEWGYQGSGPADLARSC